VHDDLVEFCRQEHVRLVRSLDLVCGSLPVAEDLAQETLARVCKDWSRIRGLDAPGAYAHRIAMNLAASRFRRAKIERRAEDALAGEQHAWRDPDAATGVAVRDALQRLRLDQRRVLVLRYFLGYSVGETAHVLRMPEGTVKTHTTRGLSALRDLLGSPVSAEGEVVGSA
jgi:RNA polymerase sigma factor (sigma-70 family)